MVCIVSLSRYPTKKSLKEALLKGENVFVEDPSMFNPRSYNTSDMQRGEKVIVTNHPKRSYFCTIEKDIEGNFKVY